ncbi:unnamed protein product [Lymnaea stagnalis]|uniref:Uncharacterized protein n=1 Tax=Lymnaea stagnalis TaxID=6523 RepID=A0AAV2ITG4_LYMST
MVSLVPPILFLLAVGQVIAISPGHQMRLTKKGLNYAGTVAKADLTEGLRLLQIPNQSGSSGLISWSVSNIQSRFVNVPTSIINITPGQDGLTWSLSSIRIDLMANWIAEYHKGWVNMPYSGSVDIDVQPISISVTIGIGEDQASRPSISTQGCSANIGSVIITFIGGTPIIWNLFKATLENNVRNILRTQICTVVINKINVNGEAALAKMKVSVEIDPFLLDYSLLEPVNFTADYLQSFHRGEVYWNDDKRESPFSPGLIPALSDVSNMLYLWLTEYTANTFAYTAQQHGFLRYNLTQKDLPPGTLNTSCSLPTKCIGSFIPQLPNLYPNSSVEIRINSSQTPQFTVATSGLSLMMFADLTLYAHTPNGSTPYLLTFNMSLYLTGEVSVANDKVVGYITSYSIKIGVIKSAIGDVSGTALTYILNVALETFVIPKFNEMAQAGFELPLSGDIKLKDSKLTLLNNVLLISTDLQYKTLDEDSLMFIPEIQVS